MERKKLIELVGSVFVALIFLSSYAAFGNVNAPSNHTTTIKPGQTFFANAQGVANITSYGPSLAINISCKNVSAVSTKLNALLIAMQKNGSVSSYFSQQASQVLVQAGSAQANSIYHTISQKIDGSISCTNVTASANIHLPSAMNFYVPDRRTNVVVQIPSALQSPSVAIQFVSNMSFSINVSVSAVLTTNALIYGNLSVRKV